jgi:hypothetical protein
MPGGDRTGPRGFGLMSGRGAGYCAGFNAPGFANPAPGYGMQYGYWPYGGRGRGCRHWYYETGQPGWARAAYVPPTQEQELAGLKNEAEWLKSQLEAISKRIEELEQKE